MTPTERQQRIDDAASKLEAAYAELELAMSQVSGAVRADKTMISSTIRSALDRLTAARERLGELRESETATAKPETP